MIQLVAYLQYYVYTKQEIGYMPVMWVDTINPKCFPDFGCRTVGW